MITNELKSILLDDLLGSSATKLGLNLELALSSTEPQPDGTGITEPVGNGYARLSLTNDDATFPPAVDGIKYNGIDFIWEPSGGDWENLSHWAIYDVADGNLKLSGFLDDGLGAPVVVDATDGDTFIIGMDSMRIQ